MVVKERGFKRTLEGMVTASKSTKTVSVEVVRTVRHPQYNKFVKQRMSYQVHDENTLGGVGDKVVIEECRPMSKSKRWRLKSVLAKSVD